MSVQLEIIVEGINHFTYFQNNIVQLKIQCHDGPLNKYNLENRMCSEAEQQKAFCAAKKWPYALQNV
ncbi:hypothetical protein XELAEV_18009570mg [Xenopus laevis]|uniref:Uncharacterized protein n=1 Tax=Xenopus laevis TaxID=8355 RepID=A0A974DUQ0_XENLA|nr:hypothetical protein XELAEV_18009570mg [Xenopus laevis]